MRVWPTWSRFAVLCAYTACLSMATVAVLSADDGEVSSVGVESPTTAAELGTPIVSLASSMYNVSEGGGQVTITVVLSEPSFLPVTVNYTTLDGLAVAGSDYVMTQGVLGFAPFQTSATVNVPIINDSNLEPDEFFLFTIFGPMGAIPGQPDLATVLIADDDAP